MRKRHRRENKVLKLLIQIVAITAAGIAGIVLFMLLIWWRSQSQPPQTDEQAAALMQREQAKQIVIETPERATEGSIRVFDYDGCCIYAYYGEIEIRNDGRNGKEIDIVCAGYLEGYEEHKEPDSTGGSEGKNE